MHHPLAMGVLQGIADLADDLKGLGAVKSRTVDDTMKIRPIDELHHKIEMAFRGLTKVVNKDDAGMMQLRERPRLSFKTRDKFRVPR